MEDVNRLIMETSSIKALILDMDGVLWRGDQPIGDLSTTFQRIKSLDLKFTLVTNNATLTVGQYAQKLGRFGVDLNPEQIINSSIAAAAYLRKRFSSGGNVYILGESGLIDTLAEHGFTHQENDVLAVIAAMDRQLTFEKLKRASDLIRSGALFIGTNPDRTFPTPEGLIPGAGAILAFLVAVTDTHPVIVGKPFPEMYRIALERMNAQPKNTLVVGDRLETDIAAGQEAGCATALVLSGVTTLEQSKRWSPAPDVIADNLNGVMDRISKGQFLRLPNRE